MESRFCARATSFLNHCNLVSSPLSNSFHRHSNPKHVEWDVLVSRGWESQIKVSPNFIFICWGFSLWFANLISCHKAESLFLFYLIIIVLIPPWDHHLLKLITSQVSHLEIFSGWGLMLQWTNGWGQKYLSIGRKDDKAKEVLRWEV